MCFYCNICIVNRYTEAIIHFSFRCLFGIHSNPLLNMFELVENNALFHESNENVLTLDLSFFRNKVVYISPHRQVLQSAQWDNFLSKENFLFLSFCLCVFTNYFRRTFLLRQWVNWNRSWKCRRLKIHLPVCVTM